MIGKLLGLTALGLGAYAAYRMMQPAAAGDGGTLEVPYPLGMGSATNRWRQRLASMFGGSEYDTLEDIEGADDAVADIGDTSFQWAFGTTEASAVTTALAMERIVTEPPTPAPDHDQEILMADKLESAGIHLDEDSRNGFHPVPRARVTGHASPRRLARAIERALSTEHVGVIVDTSKNVVEIDEHHDVGRGNVLLIDSEGSSKLLRHGSMRSLLAALASASDQPIEPS